jgi:Cellulase (glycosyl hydrolase family 5)/Carbohydrate binding domain
MDVTLRRIGVVALTVAACVTYVLVPPADAATPGAAAAKPAATLSPKATAAVTATASPTPSPKVTTTATTKADKLTAVKTAKVINYYPAGAGWTSMWTSWNRTKIDADLAKASSMGADCVRIVVFPDTFGFPTPQAPYTDRLRDFVTMAAAHKMTAKITLFDWWDRYNDTAGSATWIRSLLGPYANDPRVLTVELKNEMDPGDAAAMSWARAMLPVVGQTMPNTPVTVTVPGSGGTAALRQLKSQLSTVQPDYYDFHFYAASQQALSIITEAKGIAAPAPLVIGETGTSTYGSTEDDQAAYLARVFTAADDAGIGSVGPWTLNDFLPGAIPSTSAVSGMPTQYQYGLFRTDGSTKAAAKVVKSVWTGASVSEGLLNLGFEGTNGVAPWRAYLPQLGAGVRSTAAAHSGTASVMFTGTGGTSSGMPSVRLSPIESVVPGQQWRVQAWAKGSNARGTNQVALSWFDSAGRYLGQNSSTLLPAGTTNWTALVGQGTAPASAAALEIHLKSGNNSGTVWFDDVTISH